MVEGKSDDVAVKPDIERIDDGTDHRRSERAFVHFGGVGRHDGDRIALFNPALGKRRGELFAALVGLGPGIAPLAVYDRRVIRINGCRAANETEGRKRRVIRRCLIQINVVNVHIAHHVSPYNRVFDRCTRAVFSA